MINPRLLTNKSDRFIIARSVERDKNIDKYKVNEGNRKLTK